jgi:hypothetical protein
MLLVPTTKIPYCLLVVLLGCYLAGQAAEPEVTSRDTLVYKDGDRVRGRLVGQKDKVIIFQSDRFGELKVPASEVVVITAEKPAGPTPLPAVTVAPTTLPPARLAVPAAKPGEKAAEQAEAERDSIWEHFAPVVLKAHLRDFFGPWHGKFAFSAEMVSNTADQDNAGMEMQLQRKWKSDEVQLKGRYDFSETNHLTTTDLMKADGLWRHDFPEDVFALYHPNLEWNRASFNKGVPNDYVQMQQEIGAGVSLWPIQRRKVRIGVSENLFDVWNTTPGGIHTSRTVESAFLESELKMPWRMSLAQRGVYYYSVSSGKDGWENRIELSKKFTETLSTSLRQETRRYNPDGMTQDYSRLKLLFGVDF